MQFNEMNIMPDILKALKHENYVIPTPIQEKGIPVILEGRDLLACAQTGTGKTAAFAIPTLQLLSNGVSTVKTRKIRALVLTPTRELALQIYENFTSYGKYCKLKTCVIFGGVSQKPQEVQLRQGVDILVATPGRLIDLINQKMVDLQDLKILVLDEADRMLDMGFIHDVKRIVAKTPAHKQTLLFSATMPDDIEKLSKEYLKNPVKVEITPVSSTVDLIQQFLYFVDKNKKKDLLTHILKRENISSVLVFSRTKHGANQIVRHLEKEQITATAIHGNKSQTARQRALNDFKQGKLKVLVATDIAARGIDIDELSHVINFNLPEVPETYVHRIGRTGRAGHDGVAISFCDFEEKELLANIEKLIAKRLQEVTSHPYPLMNTVVTEKKASPSKGVKNKTAESSKQKMQKSSRNVEQGQKPAQKPAQKSKQSTDARPKVKAVRGKQNDGKSFKNENGKASGFSKFIKENTSKVSQRPGN